MSVACAIRSLREPLSQRPNAAILSRSPRQRQRRRHELLFVAQTTKSPELLQIRQELHPADAEQKILLVVC